MGRELTIPTFLAEEARFLRRLWQRPRGIGAVAPSSAALARALAEQIPLDDGPVLELGPGTGVVTEAILARGVAPGNLTAIEFDADFAALVAKRFPSILVIRGDAFDLARTLGAESRAPYSAIVSGLPLLNFPLEARDALIAQLFAHLAPSAPFIQFSYGLSPPVPPPAGIAVARAGRVLLNLPPARVWVYRQDPD